MAKVPSNALDKQNDALTNTEVAAIPTVVGQVVVTGSPVVICGVQRKANIGNFETIDIYMAVAMPQDQLDVADWDEFQRVLGVAAEQGFSVAARETASRYHLVKDSLKTPKS